MSNSNLLSVSAICLGVTLLAACEQAPVESPEIVRPVRILTISDLGSGDSLSYPGEIRGAQNVDLAFEVAGRIIEMPVKEGMDVAEGDVLARLDPADFQSALDAAEARFRQSKETFDRFSEVFERGAISRQELDMRQRQFEVEQANLATARKAVSDTALRAPFSGRIGRIHIENFNNVQAKQAILLLQDLTHLEVVVNVPEQDWLRARPGLTLAQRTERARPEVSLSTLPGQSFPAAITEVATSADPVTRTFAVRARFDPPDDVRILPGMSATFAITVLVDRATSEAAVFVPAAAVVGGNDGGSYVWKIDGESMTVSLAAVTTGRLSGAEIEIVDGLQNGDRIAVSGVQHLEDGVQIRELKN
jgi:RND family efflux transporter MFP subunit